MITRSNYEEFFLDFHEGNLDESRRRELMLFLDANSDLKDEFNAFENVTLEPEFNTRFENKEGLKRGTISPLNYKTWLLGYFEGDLDAGQRKEVEKFIVENPAARAELDLFGKTRSVPDLRIVFENKSSLRRGGKVIAFSSTLYRTLAVAASLALLMVAFYIYRKQHDTTPELAQKHAVPVVSQPAPENSVSNGGDSTIPQEQKQENKIIQPEKKPVHFQTHRSSSPGPVQQHPEPELQTVPEQQLVQQPAIQPAPEEKKVNDNLYAESKPAAQPAAIPGTRLSDVFSAEDMKELGIGNNASVTPDKKSAFWSLAEKGANKLSNATGKEISVDKSHDLADNSTTYALELGKFSISHTSVK